MSVTQKASMMLGYSFSATAICCLILLLYVVLYRNGRRIRIEDVFLMIILVVISSLRYDVGSDYLRYLESATFAANRFEDIRVLLSKEILKQYSFEVGYEALSILVSKLTNWKFAIFWVVSLILYIPIVVFCRKNTGNARVAVAVFLLFGFWGLTLNILKQAIAMMLMLYAFVEIEKKRYVLFFVLSVVATSFHITTLAVSVIMLMVHFRVLKRFLEPNRRNLLIMILLGVVLRFSTGLLIRVISRVSFYSKFLTYLDADASSSISRKYILYGAFFETAIVVFILYYAIEKLPEIKKNNFNIDIIITLIMLGIPFSIVGISRTLWLSNRFAKFFFLFLIVLIPELLNSETRKISNTLSHFRLERSHFFFWIGMIAWHATYAVLMLDNNGFHIQTYLFK